jgi:hemoglobin/transferrin/lactoferrin receptor protein
LLGSVFASVAVCSNALAQSGHAAASGASGDTDVPLTLDTITVAGQGAVDPSDVPYVSSGSSAYISGEQIERFRGTSVGDFLSGIPGVMNGDARNSGAVDVNIRGMQGQGRAPGNHHLSRL